MSAEPQPLDGGAAERWQASLRRFKEDVAKRLWSLPGVSETEKEIAFRGMLEDLDKLDRALEDDADAARESERRALQENDLLRSLLGVPGDELKTRAVAIQQELALARERCDRVTEEAEALRARAADLERENEAFRSKNREIERETDRVRLHQLKLREDDIRYFSEANEQLKAQVQDLESRLRNLRELFADSNQKLVTEKQEEITLLQRRLLDEMEATLRRKQELVWGEEEMFAKGIAHKVRTSLVSAQGQLLLTLERLGLLDPETKSEAFWKARIRLLVDGAEELAENFRAVQGLLKDVTQTLDDYLHLTHRRDIAREAVSLRTVIQGEMAQIFLERRPTLSVEFLSDDPVPDVEGDPSLLRFIVRELLRNALEALPNESGRIVVAIKNRTESRRIEVSVRDTGTGVAAHVRDRLFQPFFTTKPHRQGLSLSRARRYAEYHNGILELADSGSDGTIFRLELPVMPLRPEARDASALMSRPPAGGTRWPG